MAAAAPSCMLGSTCEYASAPSALKRRDSPDSGEGREPAASAGLSQWTRASTEPRASCAIGTENYREDRWKEDEQAATRLEARSGASHSLWSTLGISATGTAVNTALQNYGMVRYSSPMRT